MCPVNQRRKYLGCCGGAPRWEAGPCTVPGAGPRALPAQSQAGAEEIGARERGCCCLWALRSAGSWGSAVGTEEVGGAVGPSLA